MKTTAAIIAFAAALGAAPSFAQGWYAGVGVGQGSVDFPKRQNLDFDEKDTVYQLRLGYRFHPNLGVEVGYYDMGEYSVSAGSGGERITVGVDARSFGISLVGTLPLDRFDLYGRVGYARSEVEASVASAGQGFAEALGFGGTNQRTRENEWFGAVGGRWNINRALGVFAEYQHHDKLEVKSYFVGVDWRF
jgi:opacity protein-like surface antigen